MRGCATGVWDWKNRDVKVCRWRSWCCFRCDRQPLQGLRRSQQSVWDLIRKFFIFSVRGVSIHASFEPSEPQFSFQKTTFGASGLAFSFFSFLSLDWRQECSFQRRKGKPENSEIFMWWPPSPEASMELQGRQGHRLGSNHSSLSACLMRKKTFVALKGPQS